MTTTDERIYYLCRTCFDEYADNVQGRVALATDFDGEHTKTCPCGQEIEAGAAFPVHRKHYDQTRGVGAAIHGDFGVPPTEEASPECVFENEEVRVVRIGTLWKVERALKDAMGGTAWAPAGVEWDRRNDSSTHCALLRAIHDLVQPPGAKE